jgi:TrmH family RNA methyltransferase
MSFLQQIKIILVGTTHPGNIGASARAMKVMGLRHLCLVAPKFEPNAQSYAMATEASDLLSAAERVDTLSEALKDCSSVFGTTARERTLHWPVISPGEAAAAALSETQAGKLALVFGREDAGLSNDEVSHCHKLIRIPTADDCSSLNLAQAVQVCTYELRLASLGASKADNHEAPHEPWADPSDPPASGDASERLYEHWMKVMTDTEYFYPDNPRLMPQRIRRMLAKSRYSVTETQILRGFLTAVEKSIKNRDDG